MRRADNPSAGSSIPTFASKWVRRIGLFFESSIPTCFATGITSLPCTCDSRAVSYGTGQEELVFSANLLDRVSVEAQGLLDWAGGPTRAAPYL